MGKKIRLLAVCLALALCVCGCSMKMPDLSAVTGANKTDTEKFNVYIDFQNYCQGKWLDAVVRMYFEQFGFEEEPDLSDAAAFTLGETEGKESMYEMYKGKSTAARRYTDEKPEYGEADQRMKELCDAFDVFFELYFNQVNRYYTDEEYKADGYARGKELHREMLKCYLEFAEATNAFGLAFEQKSIEMQQADLPKMQEKGLDIHYYALSFLLNSQQTSLYFQQLILDGVDYLDADLSVYRQMYDTLTSDMDALKEAYKKDGQLAKDGYTSNQQVFLQRFIETAEMMMVAATDMLHMIEAGSEDVENEMSGLVTTGGRNYPMSRFDQRLEQLISAYNQSIS
ncbi:MAG: YiiG family protein [Anaerotruncus sp.]|nr:YiiG family protein [Anaerotruncus sp.]